MAAWRFRRWDHPALSAKLWLLDAPIIFHPQAIHGAAWEILVCSQALN
jgi:hypothetical protein